ncbi:LysR family transcriptional regulator [Paenarthrobacter nitroguajacolicus]|uniref:LysR family transcriptional regulator n=1 Tax=Paenarthrobacter nitroguajacolicus TaxID=211146 RepID=UPI0028650FC6|nr:LysR family transcriptional regulator [Paenarthrobacter nitroguajacolicus]MDR6637009.1 DNA-binding transcriptional LysR family regulator [Paenarthrobacter nitroguajacolicus]
MSSRPDVTLAQLEALIAAGDAGSVSTAAAMLHTSQSNLSISLGNLERRLGVELLVRHRSKGVSLTAIGRKISIRARDILEAVHGLQDAARGELDELEGEVRIGCYLPLTPFYIPRLMADLREGSPHTRLAITEGSQDVLQRAVLDGELDLALVYDQSLPDQLDFHHLAYVWPYVIAAPASEIGASEQVSLLELSAYTMVNYETAFTAARSLDLFRSAGAPLPAEVRATSLDSVRALVAAGVGFSILNQRWGTDLTADGARVVSIELSDQVTPLGLGVLTRPSTRSAKVSTVISLLGAHAKERHSARE